MFEDTEKYERPLTEFLNRYAGRNQDAAHKKLDELSELFLNSITVFQQSINRKPFRITKTLNVAVFDSCMVGMARRLSAAPGKRPNPNAVEKAYEELLADSDYIEAVSRSTADEAFVQRRIEKATLAFAGC